MEKVIFGFVLSMIKIEIFKRFLITKSAKNY